MLNFTEQELRQRLIDECRKFGLHDVGALSTERLIEVAQRERRTAEQHAFHLRQRGNYGGSNAMDQLLDGDSISEIISRTGDECAKCDDAVHFTDEVFMMTVCAAFVRPEGVAYEHVLADDGDFEYGPIVIELACWEELIEEVHEAMENVPPVLDPRSILDCSVCESGIMQGESFALITFGEIHCSNRTPDGDTSKRFETYDNHPVHLCICCLRYIQEEKVELWEGQVQQGSECREGTFYRCWRYGCPGEDDCQKKT